jgi:hypothetical protein
MAFVSVGQCCNGLTRFKACGVDIGEGLENDYSAQLNSRRLFTSNLQLPRLQWLFL